MWEQDDSGRVHTPLEPLVLAATLALIPVLILEADASGSWETAAFVANWIIWLVFAVELAAVLIVANRKGAALRAHWLDVAIVALTIPLFGQLLSSLRLLRLARLLRLLRIGVVLGRALQAEKSLTSASVFRFAALITALVVIVGGAAQAAFNADEFENIWDAIWWATQTVTTVGYGDYVIHDVEGRIIAIVVMLVGIGFISILTATVASRFVQTDTDSDEVIQTLRRIEADVADLKAHVGVASGQTARNDR